MYVPREIAKGLNSCPKIKLVLTPAKVKAGRAFVRIGRACLPIGVIQSLGVLIGQAWKIWTTDAYKGNRPLPDPPPPRPDSPLAPPLSPKKHNVFCVFCGREITKRR